MEVNGQLELTKEEFIKASKRYKYIRKRAFTMGISKEEINSVDVIQDSSTQGEFKLQFLQMIAYDIYKGIMK